jgi:hypothetical protein
MLAYKLVRKLKNGQISPLFINKKMRIEFDKWYPAEPHKTKGFAFRPGWHCTHAPRAPHLSNKNRVWCEVEIEDFKTIVRPENQGGIWYLANKIKFIREID